MILLCKVSTAQIAIRGYYYQPLFDFRYFMKPATSLEIGYLPDFNGHQRINAAVTYLKMQPKRKEFDNTNTSELTILGMWPYNESQVIRTYQKYEIYQAFFEWDFALIKKEEFQLYLGPGIMGGKINDVHTVVSNSMSNSGIVREGSTPFDKSSVFFVGLRHCIGVQFKVSDHLNILANAQTSYWHDLTEFVSWNQAYDVGLGVQYVFKSKDKKQ